MSIELQKLIDKFLEKYSEETLVAIIEEKISDDAIDDY
jgi:hypothetical protein